MDQASLTRQEVKELLGCCTSTVDRLIRMGDVPSVRLSPRRIIIPPPAFERWLEDRAAKENHGESA